MNKSPQFIGKEKNSIISAKKKFRFVPRDVMDKIEPQTLKFRCDAFNVGVAQVCANLKCSVEITIIYSHDLVFFF